MYEQIFGALATLQVEFYDYTYEAGDVFWAVGRERGRLEPEDGQALLDLAIRTT